MLGLAAAPKGGAPGQSMGSPLADQIPRDSLEELRARNIGDSLIEHIRDKKLWGDIHRAAKKNPLLQDALDRVKIIYELSKDNESKIRD
jgi:hypothetical protein